MVTDLLEPLRIALKTGDPDLVIAALPEPPHFLPALLLLPLDDRNAIITGLFPLLPTDEDRWEIIEATAMDTIKHPERESFLAVAPLIPESLMRDTRVLVESIHQMEARHAMEAALNLS